MKLKAFTITELLIVMILSIVIAAAAFSSLQMVSSLISNTEREQATNLELHTLVTLMQEDFSSANLCKISASRILELGQDSFLITYEFQPTRTVRAANHPSIRPDTFSISARLLNHSFEGTKVDNSVIDHFEIIMSTEKSEQHYPVTLHKHYSSKQLQQINHGHRFRSNFDSP